MNDEERTPPMPTVGIPMLTADAARQLGHALLQCGGRLVSRPGVRDDPGELAEIARTLAAGLKRLEGALGRVVPAPPAGVPCQEGGVYPGLIDGEVS